MEVQSVLGCQRGFGSGLEELEGPKARVFLVVVAWVGGGVERRLEDGEWVWGQERRTTPVAATSRFRMFLWGIPDDNQ